MFHPAAPLTVACRASFTDGEEVKTFSCQPKQPWQPASLVPDCVTEDTEQASYDVTAAISYRSNGAVAPECVNMYKVWPEGVWLAAG